GCPGPANSPTEEALHRCRRDLLRMEGRRPHAVATPYRSARRYRASVVEIERILGGRGTEVDVAATGRSSGRRWGIPFDVDDRVRARIGSGYQHRQPKHSKCSAA